MTHHCTTCNRQVLHDGTTCIERYAQAKAAEAERLREIVERLPVTADGVRVVPGDTVLWLRIGPRGGVRIERVKVGCEGEIGTWWCSDNCNSMGDEWELLQDSLADCYATIEAVEAALPARKEKEDDN